MALGVGIAAALGIGESSCKKTGELQSQIIPDERVHSSFQGKGIEATFRRSETVYPKNEGRSVNDFLQRRRIRSGGTRLAAQEDSGPGTAPAGRA